MQKEKFQTESKTEPKFNNVKIKSDQSKDS